MDAIVHEQGERLIETAILWYYAAVFVVGFGGGLFRTAFNGNYRNWFHCFATGVLAGCVATCVVGFWTHFVPLRPANSMFFLCVSMAVGLSGSEALLLIVLLNQGIKTALKRLFGDWESGK